jgi:succinate dehydrogenase / fumarate reductase iron-sulfur subunit
MKITLTIQRFNPETDSAPYKQSYELEAGPTDRVLDLLMEVKRTRDGTLAFRKSCAHGVCGSDAMVINGKERLACKTLVQDTVEGEEGEITVEPMKHLTIQRDLMVLQNSFFEKYRSISPFFIPREQPPESGEYIQSREDREAFDDPTKCILCGACYSACPVLDDSDDFIGPAACAQAARFVKDSRDKGLVPRLGVLDTDGGVWSCQNHFECTRVCPRGIKVTKLINETKREIKKHNENT